jgi:GTP-binding protein
LDTLPFSSIDEVAFIGRSNVGKSSLINALTKVNDLARASSTPGRTQSLNFFNWADFVMLVDLPGYGYAKASKELAFTWQTLMKDYLRGRVQLKRVFLLIDSRHGVKETDKEMMKMLDGCGILYQLVFTKIDKLKKEELEKLKAGNESLPLKHGAMFSDIIYTSAEKNIGTDILRKIIINLE